MKNNWHKDPYLYDDVPVLKNIPGVKTSEELKRIEGDLTRMTMGIVYTSTVQLLTFGRQLFFEQLCRSF